MCSNVDDFNNRNIFFTAKLLKQGYGYNKIRRKKHFLNSTTDIQSMNIGLKSLLQQGLLEPIFYGDLVYKFKRIAEKPNFNDEFKKIIKRYIKSWIQFGCHATVCMHGCKPNRGL